MSLEAAVALMRARRFAEAEAALRTVAAAAPGEARALEMLGVAVGSQGRQQEALGWFDRALAARPGSPSAHHNRARALAALGRPAEARADLEAALAAAPALLPAWTELGGVLLELGDASGAEAAYRRATQLRPELAEVHYNLGVFLQRTGRSQEAAEAYRRAIAARPAFPAALNNLGNVLRALGRNDEAYAQYAQALRVDPGFAEAHSNWGAALREAGRLDEAIPLLERAIALKPDSAGALNNLGIAHFARGGFEAAIECYRRALEARPGFHEALTNMGNALAALARWDEAEHCYAEVIAREPRRADAHNNLGLLLQDRGDADAALASFERALALDPAHADAISNLGFLLDESGRREEAMAHYRRALEANPNHARAAFNLAIGHLYRFEFARGWELAESRYDTVPPTTPRRALAMPHFTAADWGSGHRLALWREQGVGDQVLYATLLPELAARGERFVVEVDRRLVPALARAHPAWEIVAPEESAAAFARCDRHLALGSLPALLRPDLASFSAQPRALLAADAQRARAFRERLGGGARIVGISWRSFQPKVRGRLARRKSAPLAAFAAFSQAPGIRLLDLQYGDTGSEREEFARAGGRLERLDDLDLFNDIDGVLAAIEACDVVVTTSNVTAHFAGALGKRTLLVYLKAAAPFHYWTPGPGGGSLWYPSVEIVTAPELETWDQALARVHERLAG